MKYFAMLFCLFSCRLLLAQAPVSTPAPVIDTRNLSLEERYQAMKSKAESYQDYKVIKSTTLDAEWKIVMDSVKANKSIWQDVKNTIAVKEAEVKESQKALVEKEASMTEITYDSKHISFLGISFSKATFIVIFIVLVFGLVVLAGGLAAKLKMMGAEINEKADLAQVTIKEFEEYKTKALDRQTKLSRELQNERNKLSEMRHN